MKVTVVIGEEREEIVIYAKERYPFIDELEERFSGESDLFGVRGDETVRLHPSEVELFTVRGGRIYAISESGEYLLRERLYVLENRVGGDFVKINQSTLANIKKISRFKVSVGGALCVIFKCGYSEYVSRRQLKAVKTALGLK